jgi:maleylacetoacetate isomerase
LRVIKYLETELGAKDSERMQWYHHWLSEGFNAAEVVLAKQSSKYCFTEAPSVADICLVAQVYNANRFNFDLADYPEIRRINELCLNLVAFQRAIPENQPDAN